MCRMQSTTEPGRVVTWWRTQLSTKLRSSGWAVERDGRMLGLRLDFESSVSDGRSDCQLLSSIISQ